MKVKNIKGKACPDMSVPSALPFLIHYMYCYSLNMDNSFIRLSASCVSATVL